MNDLSKTALWAGIALLVAIISFVFALLNKNKSKKVVQVSNPAEERTVIGEKLIVYNKAHKSTGILTELEIGTKYLINSNTDFAGFFKVRLNDGQIGYIDNLILKG